MAYSFKRMYEMGKGAVRNALGYSGPQTPIADNGNSISPVEAQAQLAGCDPGAVALGTELAQSGRTGFADVSAAWNKVKRSAKFTLIELLVVVGTIGILVSMLLPALATAKESAKRVNCMSNQKQITAAALMYASEDKDADYLPLEPGAASTSALWNGTRWFGPGKLTRNYVDKKVFFCPSQSTYNEGNATFGIQNAGVAGKPCVGSFYFHGDADTTGINIQLGRNTNPVEVPFSSDYDTHDTPIEYDNGVWQDLAHKKGTTVYGKNVAYLDGHAGFVIGTWDSRWANSGADTATGACNGTWSRLKTGEAH